MKDDQGWRRFLVVFTVVFTALLITAAITIVLVDPLGISPIRVVSDRYLPQTNRRYIIPAIVRSGRYDSYIVGTSTVHLLDPIRLNDALGGRFANLSLAGSTPLEQVATVRFISKRPVKTLVWGLDVDDWCSAAALPAYHSHVGAFPNWLYDDNRSNDWLFLLNAGVIDLARRKIAAIFSKKDDQPRADGYQRILPRDHLYDVVNARSKIYRDGSGRPVAWHEPVSGSARNGHKLPNLDSLIRALEYVPSEVRVLVVFMPVHVAHFADRQPIDLMRLADCKAAVSELLATRNGWVLDAAWPNAWTAADNNFWDSIHFRDHVANELIDAIVAIRSEEASGWADKLIVLSRAR